MSGATHELLVRGIAAAKAGDSREARFCLERLLNMDPGPDECIDAWFWLSEISQDRFEQRELMEKILANRPFEARARRRLAMLNGELDPKDIINIEHFPISRKTGERIEVQADRFVCPNCGGKMVYTPDGQSLVCEYCVSDHDLQVKIPLGVDAGERDFIVAMATAKGHSSPVSCQTFVCKGCGAEFLLPPEKLSTTCSFCGSVYVVKEVDPRQIIMPSAIIPYRVNRDRARREIKSWLVSHNVYASSKIISFTGLYIPVWSFDIGGLFSYRHDKGEDVEKMERLQSPVHFSNILVPASKRLPKECTTELFNFNLADLEVYIPEYLSDWNAETFQIELSVAALEARARAVRLSKEQFSLPINGGYLVDSSMMNVESYKLILLPFWMVRYRFYNKDYTVVANGQNGHTRGQVPESGFRRIIRRLLKG